ncbi:MAG: lipoprotein-releasing system transmembrane subunit LolC [Nitrospira bacterium HGW-Nitrospira-1]|nr:MAG: lipoprotein-releasing system transmembrane subunit LolC [Nitrospira bacterium HGW-Nitrospira-1]
MKLPYEIFIAMRYLKSKKKYRAVSVTTAISIGGVAIGVMALLVVLSVMSGFHQDLQKKILGANAHIIIRDYKGAIQDYEKAAEKLKGEKDIISYAPFVLGQVMVSSGNRTHGVFLRGINPDTELKTTEILSHIKDGDFKRLSKEGDIPGVILGKELASSLGVFINDKINIVSPLGEIGPMGILPKIKQFRVIAIFEIGMFEYDSSLALTNIKSAQDFFGMGSTISGIEVRVQDIYKAPEIKKRLQEKLGFPYYIMDWMQMNKNLFSALKLEKFAMFVILVLIILVASFNIISNLIMNVIEKSREIAILKAIGATNKSIMAIFIIQGLFIGLIGTTTGVLGGFGLSYILNTWQLIKLPADVYYLSHLPVRMNLFDFITVSLSAITITFLATIYPAWQAAKLDPVEPLRYE